MQIPGLSNAGAFDALLELADPSPSDHDREPLISLKDIQDPVMQFEGDFYQIGVVVRDLERGMEQYRKLLGLGPFMQIQTNYLGRYRGWEGTIANRNAFAKWDNLYLELVEPGLGAGNAREWLETRGEGIFHLGYATDDLSQRPGGVPVCFESFGATLPNGDAAVIHLDTVQQLGYFVELSDRALVASLNNAIDDFTANAITAAWLG